MLTSTKNTTVFQGSFDETMAPAPDTSYGEFHEFTLEVTVTQENDAPAETCHVLTIWTIKELESGPRIDGHTFISHSVPAKEKQAIIARNCWGSLKDIWKPLLDNISSQTGVSFEQFV